MTYTATNVQQNTLPAGKDQKSLSAKGPFSLQTRQSGEGGGLFMNPVVPLKHGGVLAFLYDWLVPVGSVKENTTKHTSCGCCASAPWLHRVWFCSADTS